MIYTPTETGSGGLGDCRATERADGGGEGERQDPGEDPDQGPAAPEAQDPERRGDPDAERDQEQQDRGVELQEPGIVSHGQLQARPPMDWIALLVGP